MIAYIFLFKKLTCNFFLSSAFLFIDWTWFFCCKSYAVYLRRFPTQLPFQKCNDYVSAPLVLLEKENLCALRTNLVHDDARQKVIGSHRGSPRPTAHFEAPHWQPNAPSCSPRVGAGLGCS